MRKFLLLFALSLSTLLCGAQTTSTSPLPEIRDTFFGLKLGSVQSRESIQKAVGKKNGHVKANEKAGGSSVVYHNVPFAGKTWDTVRFRVDEDGILYNISFHEVNEEPASSSCTTTDKTYETLRRALDEKYGTGVESQIEDGWSTEYFGENLMVLVLSYSLSHDASELAHGKVELSFFHADHFERPRRMVYRGIR